MDLQINRLTNNSTQLFKQSISGYSLETKVLVVALIALACLATYIYYTMNTKGSAQKVCRNPLPIHLQSPIQMWFPRRTSPKNEACC